MPATTKTPVEVVQELIAIHTTRKEVVEKMKAKEPASDFTGKLNAAEKQSEEFIKALMNDLSNFGDGVPAAVERENDYHRIWKDASANLDAINPDEGKRIFFSLEETLEKTYQDILNTQADLPPEIAHIIDSQLRKIQQGG